MKPCLNMVDSVTAGFFATICFVSTIVLTPVLTLIISLFVGWGIGRSLCGGIVLTRTVVVATISCAISGDLAYALLYMRFFPRYFVWVYPICLLATLWLGIGLSLLERWREVRKYRRQHLETN